MTARTKSAADYLKALESSLRQGWLKSFNGGAKTIFEQLALLHPEHLAELDLPSHRNVESLQRLLQGARAFATPLGGNCCQSRLLWGYNCELNGEIQQDHLFPYSLGGPTLAQNRVFLCKYHNMVKSSDIHCYPWEAVDEWAKPWLTAQINRLNKDIYAVYGKP
jgi:hypothetical protein